MQPDEEFGHLAFAMTSAQAAVQWNVPGLVEAERRRDWAPVIAELKLLLRLNGWARGGTRGQRWVLKCPAYGDMAEALFEAFPDASVIHLSRDPAKVVASSASLVFEQRRIHSDAADPKAIGPEWFARTLERQRKQEQARAQHRNVAAFDLHYDEVSSDWQGAMHRLYRFLGEPLTAEAMRVMERFLGRSRDHEGHRYDPLEFGLDEVEVRQAFDCSVVSAEGGTSVGKSANSPEVPAFAGTPAWRYS
jgi:hypothetical protein